MYLNDCCSVLERASSWRNENEAWSLSSGGGVGRRGGCSALSPSSSCGIRESSRVDVAWKAYSKSIGNGRILTLSGIAPVGTLENGSGDTFGATV